MLDNSVSSPGKMGWGLPVQSDAARLDSEKRLFESVIHTNEEAFVPKADPDYNEQRFKVVRDLMEADGIEDGFSTNHVEPAVFGTFLGWLAQIIGSCVGSGGGRGWTQRVLTELFLLNEPEKPFGTQITGPNNVCQFIPYSYRAGRRRGGLNGGDGSFCSVHIEGFLQDGALPCSTSGIQTDAFPEPQNARTYRSMGNSNSFMDQFKPVATKYRMTESIKITDADQALEVMTKKFQPFMICSMWAFEPAEKHPTWKLANGTPVYIYRRNSRTSWAHNMTIVAIIKVSGKWYVIVKNSWGMTAHRNGDWFAIPIELFASWCRSAEIASIGNITLDKNEPIF